MLLIMRIVGPELPLETASSLRFISYKDKVETRL